MGMTHIYIIISAHNPMGMTHIYIIISAHNPMGMTHIYIMHIIPCDPHT